jgi:hypothetical protein
LARRLDIIADGLESLWGQGSGPVRKSHTYGSREAANSGLDIWVRELQQCGFSYRVARKTAAAVRNIWWQALAEGQDVETPVGTIRVVAAPASRRSRRFGHPVQFFREEKRIRFRPSVHWNDAVIPPKEKQTPVKTYRAVCPCGSTWFAQVEMNQYSAARYGSSPGEDLQAIHQQAKYALVCTCGRPLPLRTWDLLLPSRKINEVEQDFRAACTAAQAAFDRVAAAPAELEKLSGKTASKADVEGLLHRLEDLEKDAADMRRRLLRSRGRPKKQTDETATH